MSTYVRILSPYFPCNVEGCDNDARYVTIAANAAAGDRPQAFFSCGTCPVKHGFESVRMSDLGEFMAAAIYLARPEVTEGQPVERVTESILKMRTILGRKP